MKIRKELKSEVILKKGRSGWEAWQTDKLLYKTPGFDRESKEDVMRHIPSYEKVVESSYDNEDMYEHSIPDDTITRVKRNISNSRQIKSRFNQMNSFNKYTLSECAQYLAALFFDLRTIHFKATGSEFYTYHELAQELYEKTDEYYDDMIETALGYDSNISAMYVLPGDWSFVDENGSFDTNSQVVQTLILERLEHIYDVLENVQDYDSMVSSKIDGMLEYFDKEIYKLKQALR